MQNYGEKILSNQQSGMRVYVQLLLIMRLECKLCHIKKSDCQEYNVPTLQHL